ncbi:MAG: hypothetical protein ACKOOC_01360 [Cyanobium sp.]
MVFDWFKRRPAESQTDGVPGETAEQRELDAPTAAELVPEQESDPEVDPEAEIALPPGAPSAPGAGAIDADALAWARAAYARL